MQSSPVSDQGPPVGGPPQLVAPETAPRIASAVRYVEQFKRGGKPLPTYRTHPGTMPGAWGFLAAAATITAASGATLGSGTVTLCSRSGASLTADGESVTVYNAGGEVDGGGSGLYVKLGWTDGDWSVDVVKCS